MLYFVTPCVIINAFQRDFDPAMLTNLLWALLASVISHAICYALGYLFIHNKDEAKKMVEKVITSHVDGALIFDDELEDKDIIHG